MSGTSFADTVQAAMAPGFTLPPEFRLTFDWMEANGFVQTYRSRPDRYAALYPGDLAPPAAQVAFIAPPEDFMRYWLGIEDPAVTGRVTPFIRMAGDGTMAGLWQDDAGQDRFVLLGSGSGSTTMCVLADSPVGMLRFLAIGYLEAAYPDEYGMTPAEAARRAREPYVAPVMFQEWVQTTFGVLIPERASEIVQVPKGEGAAPSDPFARWLDLVQGR